MATEIQHTAGARSTDALLRGLVWALVGVVFGFVFIILHQALDPEMPLYLSYPAATVGAGALGALIYGSMRLTVIVASYAFVTVIGLSLLAPALAGLAQVMLAGGVTGAVIGGLYGHRVTGSRIYRAESKVLAGAVAGLAASVAAVVPGVLAGPIPFPWLTVILCPATGLLYIALAPRFVQRFGGLLPPAAGGAIAGAGVGALMGLAFVLMAGSVQEVAAGVQPGFVSGVLANWPAAVAGGAAAGFAGGVLRAALGARWVDL